MTDDCSLAFVMRRALTSDHVRWSTPRSTGGQYMHITHAPFFSFNHGHTNRLRTRCNEFAAALTLSGVFEER